MQKIIEMTPTQSSMLLGAYNKNVRNLERDFLCTIEPAAAGLVLNGEDEAKLEQAALIVERLYDLLCKGHNLTEQTSCYLADSLLAGDSEQVASYNPDLVCVTAKGREIKAKTKGQANYVKAILHNEITFAIGPAGTGKTFLAVAIAVNAFRKKEVDRIILTRPAVEAGEKLGFLPGDLQTKVDPYMRPLYDALQELMGVDQYLSNLEKGLIEVSPLAYMRGRTLDNAFIILDEAQNTTPEQMKMFLTRLGFNSKVVVTGDLTQIDLEVKQRSGLQIIKPILQHIESIEFIELNNLDVVRNPLVQKIVAAYEVYDKEKGARFRRKKSER